MRRSRGFTLLEVMMATAVLAVGTVSVLMIFGTAISFAHRRQGQQQLTQVLQEAGTDARALVNSYRPKAAAAAAAGSRGDAGGRPTPAGATADTEPKNSAVYTAYQYTLHFDPVDPDVPESGWQTTITVNWGQDQSFRTTQVIAPDVIPDDEFAYSRTYEAERAGQGDRTK